MKLIEVIEDTEKKKHNETKLLDIEKLKIECAKVELGLAKLQTQTKSDNLDEPFKK